MIGDSKILIITDSATKPECHLAYANNQKERESSFMHNPLEGAISQQEFESRSAVLQRSSELSW